MPTKNRNEIVSKNNTAPALPARPGGADAAEEEKARLLAEIERERKAIAEARARRQQAAEAKAEEKRQAAAAAAKAKKEKDDLLAMIAAEKAKVEAAKKKKAEAAAKAAAEKKALEDMIAAEKARLAAKKKAAEQKKVQDAAEVAKKKAADEKAAKAKAEADQKRAAAEAERAKQTAAEAEKARLEAAKKLEAMNSKLSAAEEKRKAAGAARANAQSLAVKRAERERAALLKLMEKETKDTDKGDAPATGASAVARRKAALKSSSKTRRKDNAMPDWLDVESEKMEAARREQERRKRVKEEASNAAQAEIEAIKARAEVEKQNAELSAMIAAERARVAALKSAKGKAKKASASRTAGGSVTRAKAALGVADAPPPPLPPGDTSNMPILTARPKKTEPPREATPPREPKAPSAMEMLFGGAKRSSKSSKGSRGSKGKRRASNEDVGGDDGISGPMNVERNLDIVASLMATGGGRSSVGFLVGANAAKRASSARMKKSGRSSMMDAAKMIAADKAGGSSEVVEEPKPEEKKRGGFRALKWIRAKGNALAAKAGQAATAVVKTAQGALKSKPVVPEGQVWEGFQGNLPAKVAAPKVDLHPVLRTLALEKAARSGKARDVPPAPKVKGYRYVEGDGLLSPPKYNLSEYGSPLFHAYAQSRSQTMWRVKTKLRALATMDELDYSSLSYLPEFLDGLYDFSFDEDLPAPAALRDLLLASVDGDVEIADLGPSVSIWTESYEATGKIYTAYDKDGEAVGEDFGYMVGYGLLALSCLVAYERLRNLKLLNVGLKLIDMMSSVLEERMLDALDVGLLFHCLDIEQQVLSQLYTIFKIDPEF